MGRPFKDNFHLSASVPTDVWQRVRARLEAQHGKPLPLGAISGLIVYLLQRWLDEDPTR